MPYFHDNKICSNVNKLTRQKSKLKPFPLLKSETSVEPHMSHVNSLYLVFYISREGGWEFHPFWKGSVTHPTVTAFTHPNAGVFARVLRQQVTGKHNPVKAVQCLLPLWWRKNKSCIPGSKHSTCRLCPDFASNQTAKKGKRASHHLCCACYHFICRIEILHLCSSDSCAQWQRLIYVSVCECVFVSGVWIF